MGIKTQLAFIVVCCSISLIKSQDSGISIEVSSDPLFIGDKAKFFCSAPVSDFEDNLEWEFENKDGNIVTPYGRPENEIKGIDGERIFRTSFLTVTNASSVRCVGLSKSGERLMSVRMITVNNASPLPPMENRCSNIGDIPKIILWRYDSSGFESRFWVPHIVTNSVLQLSDRVSNFRLICQFNSSVQFTLSQLKFRPTIDTRNGAHECSEEVIEVNPVSSASSREYICSSIISSTEVKISSVSLHFPENLPPPLINIRRVYDNETVEPVIIRIGNNSTDNAITDGLSAIVEVADSTKAYTIGFGSSGAGLLMMVAVVFLKKTLQRRKQEEQSQPGTVSNI